MNTLSARANRVYVTKKGNKDKLKKLVKTYVKNDRFLSSEIRLLEFTETSRKNALFNRLLSTSYNLRCDYVHDAKMISPLSEVADKMSLAFVSNDNVSLFPSHIWLRRIAHLALTNFLSQQQNLGNNTLNDYFRKYEEAQFIARKRILAGQLVTENDVYLQRLTNI